jgi:hypothetical protein
MKTPIKISSLFALALVLAGTAWLSAAEPASRCQNVFFEGSGPLTLAEVPGSPGVFTIAFAPQPAVLGDVPGLLGSIVTSQQASGSNGQAAQHVTLQHTFISTDPARPGSFTTRDRAVCAPAGSNPGICRVNDVLTIVSGTEIFANANGSLRNHGIIDLTNLTPTTPGNLTISLRGRICGDGL